MAGIVNFNAFLLTAVLLNLTPGTDTLYILSRTIFQGRRAGVYSALGIGFGIFVHTLMITLGLSLVLAQSPILLNIVKYAGAGYLFYLGLRSLWKQTGNNEVRVTSLKMNRRSIFLEGAVTNIMNPKVALFFLGFLAQFVHPNKVQSPMPYFLLGVIFMATGTTWNLVLAFFGTRLKRYVAPDNRTGAYLEKALGVVFVFLALSVVF